MNPGKDRTLMSSPPVDGVTAETPPVRDADFRAMDAIATVTILGVAAAVELLTPGYVQLGGTSSPVLESPLPAVVSAALLTAIYLLIRAPLATMVQRPTMEARTSPAQAIFGVVLIVACVVVTLSLSEDPADLCPEGGGWRAGDCWKID